MIMKSKSIKEITINIAVRMRYAAAAHVTEKRVTTHQNRNAVSISIIGYRHEIAALHERHFPRSIRKLRTGTLS